jgi:addiction module RelE/StbE family toxin
MNVKFSKKFIKKYTAAPEPIKQTFNERMRIFSLDEFDQILNNHQLSGNLKNLRSINIGGDWRAIFEESDNGDIVFKTIGNHSQLYGK